MSKSDMKEIKVFTKFDITIETGGSLDLLQMHIERLRKKFDPELALDLKTMHGIDMEEELKALALEEMSKNAV